MLIFVAAFSLIVALTVPDADAPGGSLPADAETLAATDDTLSAQGGGKKTGETGKRIAKKLGNGALLGALFGLAGGGSLEVAAGGGGADGIGAGAGFLLGGVLAFPVGTAIGVRRVDPHVRFIVPMAGSTMGLTGSIELIRRYPFKEWYSNFLPIFVAPVVGATVMSELRRNSPETHRVSVGLMPDPRGSLSAVATLHF